MDSPRRDCITETPLFFYSLGGVFVSLGLGWLHPDQQRAPVAIPLFSACVSHRGQDQVAGICSSQTKLLCFLFSPCYVCFGIGSCTIGIAVLR